MHTLPIYGKQYFLNITNIENVNHLISEVKQLEKDKSWNPEFVKPSP